MTKNLPICEVTVIDTELVEALRPDVERLQGVSSIFKALADDARVKIIYALSRCELCVCDIAALLGVSKATASYHLRLLHHMGVVGYRKEGKLVYYFLADERGQRLIEEVCGSGKNESAEKGDSKRGER